MKILRWMRGKTRKDRIRNERLQEHLRVASIDDKLRERIRVDGLYMSSVGQQALLRKSLSMQVDGLLRRRDKVEKDIDGSSKDRCEEVQSTPEFDLGQIRMERSEWRNRLHVVDFSHSVDTTLMMMMMTGIKKKNGTSICLLLIFVSVSQTSGYHF